MSKVVAAFGWIIAGPGGANGVPQDLPCATAGLAQDRLQLRKRQRNRIEVRTVFRQKPELRADGFDRSSHRGALVTREVVHDDDVARRERWRQDLLDVGQKTGAVDRAIKHGWRGEACHAQRPEKRRGVPAAIRRVVGDPGAGQPTAIAANPIGPHTTLIEKHEARGIERRRRGAPDRAGAADVSAIVFRRVYRFFLNRKPSRLIVRHSVGRLAGVRRASCNSASVRSGRSRIRAASSVSWAWRIGGRQRVCLRGAALVRGNKCSSRPWPS